MNVLDRAFLLPFSRHLSVSLLDFLSWRVSGEFTGYFVGRLSVNLFDIFSSLFTPYFVGASLG